MGIGKSPNAECRGQTEGWYVKFAHVRVHCHNRPWKVSHNNDYISHELRATSRANPIVFVDFQIEGYSCCLRLSVHPSVRKVYLVRTITPHRFELESPNLHQIFIIWYFRLVLKQVTDLDLEGPFGHFDLNFYEIRFSLCNNFQRIWTTITKFSPNMHLGILLYGMENGGHGHWPSRSFGSFDSEFQETAFRVVPICRTRPFKGSRSSRRALVTLSGWYLWRELSLHNVHRQGMRTSWRATSDHKHQGA